MKKGLIIALVMTMLTGLFGCGKKYRIDYLNCKTMFDRPKESCRAGSKVTLKMYPVMDETNEVYLDGEALMCQGQKGEFLIYEFTMPKHNVTIEVKGHNISVVDEMILYDYYYQVAGTEMKQPYYEIVVWDKHGELELQEYVDGGTKEEKVNVCHPSRELISDINAVIEEYDMDNWDKLENYECLDGVAESFRYYKNGSYVRVDINKLPENGERGLNAIRNTLRKHMD